METVSFMVVVFLIVGLIRRLTGVRDHARRLGPGTPARFLDFTGSRLVITERTHAGASED